MVRESGHKPILITGATGLVGSHMVRYLYQRGYRDLRGIRRADSDLSLLGEWAHRVEWFVGDLSDTLTLEEALSGVDVVFHCAGFISFRTADTAELQRTNVLGTANMVDIALYCGVQQFIYVSSIAALGRNRQQKLIDEHTRWERSDFHTRYGISKFQAEQEVWRAHAEGLPVAILNPSIILGGGHWDSGPARFFPMIARGWRFYPQGNAGFVDVRDVVQLLYLLMQKKIVGRRYIANAGHMTYQEFFTLIAQTMGKHPPTIPIKPVLAEVAWRLAALYARLTGQPPMLTRETARQAGKTAYYDNRRSIEELQFTYRPLEQTVVETAHLYQSCNRAPEVLPGLQPLPF